jgi:hypothetical protein
MTKKFTVTVRDKNQVRLIEKYKDELNLSKIFSESVKRIIKSWQIQDKWIEDNFPEEGV